MLIDNDAKVPSPQAFTPFTVIFPEVALVPKSTNMVFELLLPIAPVGNVHT